MRIISGTAHGPYAWQAAGGSCQLKPGDGLKWMERWAPVNAARWATTPSSRFDHPHPPGGAKGQGVS